MTRGVLHRWLATVVVGIVAAVTVIASAEFVARYITPWNDPGRQLHFIAGPGRFPTLGPANARLWNVSIADGWRTTVRFDRFGLRHAGDITHTDSNAIFIVGDYFPFGWGVAENERVAELLAGRLGIVVHDIALLGNLPQGDLKLLHYVESLGAPVRRVLIVLPMESAVQRYPGSPAMAQPEREMDFPSAERLGAAHVSREQYRTISAMWRVPFDGVSAGLSTGVANASPSTHNFKLWLLDHSALYRAAVRHLHSNPLIQRTIAWLGLSEVHRPAQINPEDPEAIRVTADLLAQIARQYELLVAVVPSAVAWVGEGREAERRRHADFVAALAERGVSYCDLLPAFDNAGGITALAYPRELYWNATAHKVAADALAPVIAAVWQNSSR